MVNQTKSKEKIHHGPESAEVQTPGNENMCRVFRSVGRSADDHQLDKPSKSESVTSRPRDNAFHETE